MRGPNDDADDGEGDTPDVMRVQIAKLHIDAKLPTYATDGSGAFDLYAAEDILVWTAQEQASLVNTGLSFAVPAGHALLLFARSGNASKRGIRPANCVGVVDADYRGPVMVPLVSDHPLEDGMLVKAGDRIAQGMVVPAPRVVFDMVLFLPETARGAGGFGSTGA